MKTDRIDVPSLVPAAREQCPHKRGQNQTVIADTLGIRCPTISGWLNKAGKKQVN